MVARALLVSAALCCVAAAAPGETRTPVLRSEPKLAAPVSLRARCEPLADVVAQVARDTGAVLAASSDTADEPVTLFVKSRPAQEVLGKVAEHLDYRWVVETRRGVRTLVLVQDLAAKRRQQARQDSGDAAARRWLEDRLARASGSEAVELRRLPRDERIRRLRDVQDELEGPVTVVRQGDGKTFHRVPLKPPHSPETQARLKRQLELLRLVTPEAREFNAADAVTTLYPLLTAEQRELLWQGGTVTFSFPPERDRLPLDARSAEALAAGPLGNHAWRENEATGIDTPVPFRSIERIRARLALYDRGGERRLNVRMRILGSYGDDMHTSRIERVFREDLKNWMRPTPPERWSLDAAVRSLRDPMPLPGDGPPEAGSRHGDSQEGKVTRFEEILEHVAAHVPYPILADGYQSHRMGSPWPEGERPLFQVLEQAVKIGLRHGRFEDGYLLFRDSDWANRRVAEAPARLAKRVTATAARLGALRFSELVEVGGKLTPEQVETLGFRLSRYVPPAYERRFDADLEESGSALRLLFHLPAGLRKELDGGREVPFRSLSPLARGLARRVLEESADLVAGDEHGDPGEPALPPGAGFDYEDRVEALWTQGRLSIHRSPTTWVVSGHNYYPLEQLEAAFAEARLFQPGKKLTRLPTLEGELVEVRFQIPGVQPVGHYFLDPLRIGEVSEDDHVDRER